MVRSVTSAVEIPVMVRLPHHAALNPAFARQITQNGARAISAIESLEGINGVDIENARCEMAAICVRSRWRQRRYCISWPIVRSPRCAVWRTGTASSSS